MTRPFSTSAEVRKEMLAKLWESGLEAKIAARLALDPMTAEVMTKQCKGLPRLDRAGFRIPYFTPAGKLTGFYRFRYLEYVDHSANGLARVAVPALKDRLRYAQEKGSVLEVYLPPLLPGKMSWAAYLKDPTKPLVITEGELKAAAATYATIPTIGLGGVWSFLIGGELLSGLEAIDWKGRLVYLCFDSDAARNPNVAAAENAIARELVKRGAHVHILRLPPLDGKKTGLDDYLVAKGSDAFMTTLKDAAEWETSKELFQLNAEVVFVRDPGFVLELKTKLRMSVRMFKEGNYANRTYIERTLTPKGDPKTEEKLSAPKWLKWSYRSDVLKMTYRPGEGACVDGEFNTWPGWGCEPKKGDVTPWFQLRDFLFEGAPEAGRWFEQWLAYPVRYPGTKLDSSVLMWGRATGTGKTLIGETMRRIYGKNYIEIGDKDLHGSFNGWAENRQFVTGDEIAGGEKKREIANRMKSMITQKELIINQKYIPIYTIPDCINYYFTSNHGNALYIEDTDRRLFVHELPHERPLDKSFYSAYVRWQDEEGGARSFMYYLQNDVDLSKFNPKGDAWKTEARSELVAAGLNDAEGWIDRLHKNPDEVIWGIKGSLFLVEELYSEFLKANPTWVHRSSKSVFGGLLTKGGIKKANKGAPVQGRKGQKSYSVMYVIRDHQCPAHGKITREEMEGKTAKVNQPVLHAIYEEGLAKRKG